MENKLYDLEKLDEMSPGNAKFKNDMLQLFITVSTSTMEEIKAAHDKMNLEEIKRLAHRLKPSLNSLGITSMLDEVKRIEKEELSEKTLKAVIMRMEIILEIVNRELREVKFEQE